jgi:sulfur transfer protein SufE
MLALKLSRASWNYREDNYLDLVAYAASLNEYQKQQKEKQNDVK